jgi:DNA polymerase-3 subunit alpha
MRFVHLHNHTHYSLLDGLTKLDEFIAVAKEDGREALAITDHGTMYGVIEFYQKCKKAGIKPIIGVETYLAPSSRFNKNTRSDEKNYHLLLLAKNLTGYQNLLKLITIAHLEGFYYKPRIDWEVLQTHHDGLIACSACLAGEVPRLIEAGKLDRARERILEYQELFGVGNYYLEIQDHPELSQQWPLNEQLIKFSRELNVPLVATNDTHYLKKDDAEAQDILLCLQNKKTLEDTDRMKMIGMGDYSMRPAKEMAEAFKDYPDAIENTAKIADMCNLEIELGTIQLPHFEVPEGFDDFTYLEKIAKEGLVKRLGKTYEEIDVVTKERMDYELAVVKKMGFPSYFLIVADYVNWAKSNGIVVGPGRGSAAGSFICYLIGITNLDPLKYDLLFERFLNPDRISMPDIDMDFADTRRDEVIRYVEEKYGKDHVAQIITFGTMAARAAVRDVGRVLSVPYDFCDKLAKLIPMFTKLNEALELSEVKEIYNSDPQARRVFDYAKRLEGVARHASTHACGVLITKEPLVNYVPVQYASSSDRTIVSQYSLHPIEDLGLLKMDFLGLKNLTIIESALKIIKNTRGLKVDIESIPLDDIKAYELFQRGETTGVFQFESSGMKRYLKELKPTELEDIIAMVALYRPGPMEWIPDFIAGKHGKKRVKYLHPKLGPILQKTYGVAIYQEQVMQIARDLAGFTMGEADVLRKAMGKKIAKLLAEQKDKFIDGCVKNGISKELAEQVFSFIEPFAGYGFNRSHAACYAMIAYQTAYLKAHWPAEFMAALLTSDQQDTDRIAIEIDECRKMGIEVMQPDINESFSSFTVVTSGTRENKVISEEEAVTKIRFGLKAIKNVGEHIAEFVIAERKNAGPYKDVLDLLERVTDKDMNKKSLESLIKCGALDSFGERGMFLGNSETLLSYNKEISKSKDSGQSSLFADLPVVNTISRITLSQTGAVSQREKLAWEKELLGLYITEHPFREFKEVLGDRVIPLLELGRYKSEDAVNIAGVITNIKKIQTRKNEPMLFVKLEDGVGSIEILVFPRLLKEKPEIWLDGRVVFVQGKVSDKDQEIKLLANKVAELNLADIESVINNFKNGRSSNSVGNYSSSVMTRPPVNGSKPDHLKLIFLKDLDAETAERLKLVFSKYPGENKVFVKVNNNIIETGFRIENKNALQEEIKNNFVDLIKVVGN